MGEVYGGGLLRPDAEQPAAVLADRRRDRRGRRATATVVVLPGGQQPIMVRAFRGW